MESPSLQKDFYDFRDGAKQSDAAVQEYINQCVCTLNENKEREFTHIACGDTVVMGLRFSNTIEIIVSRNYVEAICHEDGEWII